MASETKRTHLNIRVLPSVKRTLQGFADRERRPLSNVVELLLEWATKHLESAGSTLALMGDSVGEQTAIEQSVYEKSIDKKRTRRKAT